MKHAYSFTEYLLRAYWGIRRPTAGVLTPAGPLHAKAGLREDEAWATSPGRPANLSSADTLPAHPRLMRDEITTLIPLVMNQVTKREVKGDTQLAGRGALLPFFVPVPDIPAGQVATGTDSAGEIVALPPSLRTFPGKPSPEPRVGEPSADSSTRIRAMRLFGPMPRRMQERPSESTSATVGRETRFVCY